MMVYRITMPQHAHDALSGEGARLFGGRWNPKGLPLVYTAATRSLAVLEMLVQDQPLRNRYSLIPVYLPDDLPQEILTVGKLPHDWRNISARPRLQAIGRNWLERAESAVLVAPSVVLPQENNYLLNPRHHDFLRLTVGAMEILDTDSRLQRTPPAS
jgi:RES domain-containing protein